MNAQPKEIFSRTRSDNVPLVRTPPIEPLWKTALAGAGLVVFFVALMVLYPMVTAYVTHQADCARETAHPFINCAE